ncbi:S1 family peptidase [Streptomyces litchfieldiae]|uniref:S1 family peptidase n=1 Tax=Streptomyces litchfieldiae TaxID=3075543 RepID=A0ABU2MRH4_9ACTN|nr:S1 family peptidase [Streptomyces sp. DSM 44938]MDT0343493.1 S1 family peptidase [Streptomyces sp. DSM 44938]
MNRSRRTRPVTLAALTAALTAASLALTAVPARAVVGPPESGNIHGFTARLDIGDGRRACSGALVDTEWLLTAASCFADDPAVSLSVPAGKPRLATVATIGRTDLTTTSGHVRDVVELVPHNDRDLVLARLARPVPDVTPVALSTGAPAVGEELRVAGYGRTTDEWAPLTLHTGTFTVDTVSTTEVAITGQEGSAVCKGDTGGPAVRESGGQIELVAVNSRSWQGGCFGVDETETRTGAVDTRVDDLHDWVGDTVGAPRVTDFNCDGAADVAAGDPSATVGGNAEAGLARIVYGGGKGVAVIHQDLGHVPNVAEADDRFGEELAVFDHNEDGCTDLVVGIPDEDIDSLADVGMVSVLYGSPDGLGSGQAALNLSQGEGSGVVGAAVPQAEDRMGDALATGHTDAGVPYLLIGVPNKDFDGFTNAGIVFYLRGTISRRVHQDQPGVPGVMEAGDRFGLSVAGTPNHFAIGTAFESVGDQAASGMVWVFDHDLNADNIPNPVADIHQNTAGISGDAQAGDRFGATLSMAAYRPSGAAGATDSVLAVGVPREDRTVDGTLRSDSGRVVTLQVTAAGSVSELANIHQENAGVEGVAETDDEFGATVSVANTAPRAVSTASTMLLAVGVPGENIGTSAEAGAIQTFSPLGAPGDSDFWIEAGNASGLPGAPGPEQFMGRHIHATGTHLNVGMPNGPAPYGALHALPWANATGGRTGATGEVTTHQPGQGDLPASGVAFGWSPR